MFFVTENGLKDWKEEDGWYKPSLIEGYESSSNGMSKRVKMILLFLVMIAVVCAIYFLYKKKSD